MTFEYADRALLTALLKSIMLSLMKLFFGIFLTVLCILDILGQILNNFHILEEKRFVHNFFVFLMETVFCFSLTKKFQ